MTTRPAYVEDMEQTPKIFVVEQTDMKGAIRLEVMERIRSVIQQPDKPTRQYAQEIKDALDENADKFWHCIVGCDYAW